MFSSANRRHIIKQFVKVNSAINRKKLANHKPIFHPDSFEVYRYAIYHFFDRLWKEKKKGNKSNDSAKKIPPVFFLQTIATLQWQLLTCIQNEY